jgi:hypothetical protein
VAQEDQQRPLARADLRNEACGMTGDVGEAGTGCVQAQRRGRDQLRRNLDDGRYFCQALPLTHHVLLEI